MRSVVSHTERNTHVTLFTRDADGTLTSHYTHTHTGSRRSNLRACLRAVDKWSRAQQPCLAPSCPSSASLPIWSGQRAKLLRRLRGISKRHVSQQLAPNWRRLLLGTGWAVFLRTKSTAQRTVRCVRCRRNRMTSVSRSSGVVSSK